MDDYLLVVGSRKKHSTDGHNTDDRKGILHAGLHAGLLPGLEPAAEAFDAVDLEVVDLIKRGWELSGRWSELRLFGRIDSERVVEFGCWRTEILAQLQMHRKRCRLSAEMRHYPEHSVAIADHRFRKCCSGKHFADCQTCSMRTCHSTQTSSHPVEAGPVVEADFGLEKQKSSCQNVESAESAGSADRTAHMPSAQAQISLAETPAVQNDCTDIVKFGIASRYHLALLDLAAVWQMADLRVAILELV